MIAPIGAEVDLGCQDTGEAVENFFPGLRCRVAGVHHFVFAGDIGRRLVVVRVRPELGQVWAHDDKPVTYRVNRAGRRVVASDPKCIQTVYSVKHLRPHRPWPWGTD